VKQKKKTLDDFISRWGEQETFTGEVNRGANNHRQQIGLHPSLAVATLLGPHSFKHLPKWGAPDKTSIKGHVLRLMIELETANAPAAVAAKGSMHLLHLVKKFIQI
jgi:hypothetical protein